MYESPIDVIYGEMQMQLEGEIFKAVRNVGVNVDKEELLKALMYDREQYSKGYSDGYAKAIEEFVSSLSNYINLNGADGKLEIEISEIEQIAEELRGTE